MKRKLKTEISASGTATNLETKYGSFVYSPKSNSVLSHSDARWFNFYPYKDIKGNGRVYKIIGDEG